VGHQYPQQGKHQSSCLLFQTDSRNQQLRFLTTHKPILQATTPSLYLLILRL
jgi:hypothetical protein